MVTCPKLLENFRGLLHGKSAFESRIQTLKIFIKRIWDENTKSNHPVLPFLVFLENGQENHQNNKDFLSLPNP